MRTVATARLRARALGAGRRPWSEASRIGPRPTVKASAERKRTGHLLRIGNGYEVAKSRHLFRDFIDASAGITITGGEIVVKFQRRAHNPLLIAAEFDKTDTVIPWLGGKRLKLLFG